MGTGGGGHTSLRGIFLVRQYSTLGDGRLAETPRSKLGIDKGPPQDPMRTLRNAPCALSLSPFLFLPFSFSLSLSPFIFLPFSFSLSLSPFLSPPSLPLPSSLPLTWVAGDHAHHLLQQHLALGEVHKHTAQLQHPPSTGRAHKAHPSTPWGSPQTHCTAAAPPKHRQSTQCTPLNTLGKSTNTLHSCSTPQAQAEHTKHTPQHLWEVHKHTAQLQHPSSKPKQPQHTVQKNRTPQHLGEVNEHCTAATPPKAHPVHKNHTSQHIFCLLEDNPTLCPLAR